MLSTSPARYALSGVIPWVALAAGVGYAYLTTYGGPNLITHTIGASVLITMAFFMFGGRFSRAVDTQIRETQERRERNIAALLAESRARRAALEAEIAVRVGDDTRTPFEIVDSIERHLDETIRKLR